MVPDGQTSAAGGSMHNIRAQIEKKGFSIRIPPKRAKNLKNDRA